MTKFFSLRELSIIMLIILMFDINAFADIVTDPMESDQITFKIFLSILGIVFFILLDTYFFRNLIKNTNNVKDAPPYIPNATHNRTSLNQEPNSNIELAFILVVLFNLMVFTVLFFSTNSNAIRSIILVLMFLYNYFIYY